MTNMSRLLLALALVLLSTCIVAADLVVVVNAKSGIETLSQDEVINIFMGRYRQLPSGIMAQPVDLAADSPLKAEFYRKLVNKDLAAINAYWARLIFSGKTSPPQQAASAKEAMTWIASNPGGIGYIDRGMADSRLKIVLDLTP